MPTVDGPVLVLHFGMTGALTWSAGPHRHDRVVFRLANGELRYRDMRKLQGIRLLPGDNAVRRLLSDVGPDALAMSRDDFGQVFTGLRRQIKPALVDQSLVAGLGNLLADELLWRARIHPRRSCVHIGPSGLRRVHARMGTVLRQASEAGRVPSREAWLTGHRDDKPGACPRCGTTLSHGRVGGRGTTWCPHCQPD